MQDRIGLPAHYAPLVRLHPAVVDAGGRPAGQPSGVGT
jgi:hypothetical protein